MNSPEGESWTRWMHEIRRIEFEGMMNLVPLSPGSKILELGSGDGYQLSLLRNRFAHVFAVDPEHTPARASGFSFAYAEALPFNDCTFDMIVSNCVLEHLEDRERGLEEAVRVLRAGGYMAHVVPSRFWKGASLLFNLLGYPMRVGEKWWALRQTPAEKRRSESVDAPRAPRPGILQVLGRWFYPPIHGTYASHLSEFESYGRERWSKFFEHPRLVHVATAPLLCATQFGFLRFRFVPLRKWLGSRGWGGSRVFVMRKIE